MNDDLDSKPVDLSPLDPTRDSARFDGLVRAIAREAMRGTTARDDDVFDRLTRWWPTTLVAAGVILAVSVSGLFRSPHETTPASALDVLGIPVALTDVLQSNRTPSLSDLHAALTTNSGQ